MRGVRIMCDVVVGQLVVSRTLAAVNLSLLLHHGVILQNGASGASLIVEAGMNLSVIHKKGPNFPSCGA